MVVLQEMEDAFRLPHVIPGEAFDVAQAQEAQAKAPVALVVRQFHKPFSDHAVFRATLCLVAVAGLAYAKRLTGRPYAHCAILHCTHGHLAATRWPHHFFSSASSTTSALSRSSAY